MAGFRSFVFSENGHELLPPLSVSGTTDDHVRSFFRRRLLEDERRYEFFRKLTPPKVGAEICKNHVRGLAAALQVAFIHHLCLFLGFFSPSGRMLPLHSIPPKYDERGHRTGLKKVLDRKPKLIYLCYLSHVGAAKEAKSRCSRLDFSQGSGLGWIQN